MDIPTSLKGKEQSKMRRGDRGSTGTKLDGMIRWMKETGLVLQEFARINGLRAPNYPLDMFRSSPAHHKGDDGEVDFEEEGVA